MLKIPRLFLILLCLPLSGVAQFKKIKSFEVSEYVTAAAIDRPGDLYLTTVNGQILKYDHDGILKNLFKTNPPPTAFDPRDGARMFAYYRTDNSYSYLSPSFEITSHRIDSAFAIEPWLACPSGDFNLWLLDAADGSFKKINPRVAQVEVDAKINTPLNVSDIILLREYQGFVFMLHKNTGISVYNSLGKLIRTFDGKGITYFNFLGEELYYKQDETLKLFDLFSAETREMKLPESGTLALLTGERLILITKNVITLFEYKP